MIFSQALEFQGRHAEALAVISEALRLSESAPGDPYMQLVRASALNGSAWNSVQLGDLSQARAFCMQAIELCQSIGYSPGEAGTWDTLGVVLQRLGDARRGGCPASCAPSRSTGRWATATTSRWCSPTSARPTCPPVTSARPARVWDESLTILADLHHPAASEVRAKLRIPQPRSRSESFSCS